MVSSRLEVSLEGKPLAKAHALFYEGLEEVKNGDKSKIHVVYGKIEFSFFFFFRKRICFKIHSRRRWSWRRRMGVLSRKSLQESLQNSVNPFLSHLSTRSDEWEGFSASLLIARA